MGKKKTNRPDEGAAPQAPKVSLLERVTPLARQINSLDIDRISDVCVTKIPAVVGSRPTAAIPVCGIRLSTAPGAMEPGVRECGVAFSRIFAARGTTHPRASSRYQNRGLLSAR